MIDTLDASTEERLRRQIWYWVLAVTTMVVAFTVGIMWLREGASVHKRWSFDTNEFEAIGTWFSGLAAAAALFSGAALVVNDRRTQRVRDRFADANEVRYNYREDPEPMWVVRNGSARSVTLIEADGMARRRIILPGGELRLRDATMLARAGYRGDQPTGVLVFDDTEYRWTRNGAKLTGQRLTPGAPSVKSSEGVA